MASTILDGHFPAANFFQQNYYNYENINLINLKKSEKINS